MALLAQNTFTIKRLLKEPLSLEFSSDTIAIPADNAGVADLTDAEFSVRVLKDSKELFPVFDENVGDEGKNLLLNTGLKDGLSYWGSSSGVLFELTDIAIKCNNILGGGWPRLYNRSYHLADIKIDDILTLSFLAKGDSEGDSHIAISNTDGTLMVLNKEIAYTNEWSEYSLTFKVNYLPDSAHAIQFYINSHQATSINTRYYKHIKLEKGSTPTPWTPAPRELLSNATIISHNCTAVVIDDRIKLTTLTPGKNTGWVDVEVNYGEGYTAKRRFTWAKVKDGQDIDDFEIGGDNLANQSYIEIDALSNNYAHSIIKGVNSSAPRVEMLLKNDTEHVLHIGKSEKVSGGATLFSVVLFDFVTNTNQWNNTYPFSEERKIVHLKTPASGSWSLLIYAGVSGSTAGNKVRFHNVMLQEGNKATVFIPSMRYLTEAIQGELDVEGGLVLGRVMGTKDVTGEVKSYMSGLTGSNPTAFAAGVQNFGTNEETKNVDIGHDGSAKIGILEVDNSTGKVRVTTDGVTRFLITKQNLPTLLSLLSGATETDDITPASFLESLALGREQTRLIPDTLVLDKEDNTLTFTANCSVNCNLSITPPGGGPHPVFGASISIYIYRLDGASYKLYSSVDSVFSSDGIFNKIIDKSISNVPSGSYRVFLRYYLYPGGSLSLSAMTLSYVHNNEVRRIEYGKNGMMLFYNENGKKNYLYMTNEGLSIGGETDMPGVLATGSVASNAIHSNRWGAKVAESGQQITKGDGSGQNTGIYNVPHNVGNTNYTVIAIPTADDLNVRVIRKYANSIRISVKNVSNNYENGSFDYTIMGNN